MADERHIDATELMDVADDSEQAHRLHRALRTIGGSPALDGPLREMAHKVLRGDIAMKEAIETDRYTEAVYSRLREMRRAAENQTYAEQQAAAGQFARWQEERQAEEDRERAERDAPKHLRTPPGGNRGPSHRR